MAASRARVLTVERRARRIGVPRPSTAKAASCTSSSALGVGEHVYGLGERFGAARQERPDRRHLERRRRHRQRAGLQERPVLPDQPRLRRLRQPPGHGLVRGRLGERVAGAVQRAGRVARVLRHLRARRPRTSCARYTALTGRPALPPAWSFGLWLTTSFTTSYDEATVTGFIDGMAERDLPLSRLPLRLLLDARVPLVRLRVGPADVPRPARACCAGCKDRGLQICVWINPYIAQRSPLFAEGTRAAATCCKRPDGDVWQRDLWQPGMALVDFTNPAAPRLVRGQAATRCSTWASTASRPTSASASRPTSSSTTAPTRSGCTTTTRYLYNRDRLRAAARSARGDGRGGAVRPLGDRGRPAVPGALGRRLRRRPSSRWRRSCAAACRSACPASASGATTSAASRARRTPAVFKRWIAFGLLSSHSRLHGSGSYRVPWLFDEEAVDVLRDVHPAEAAADAVPVRRRAAGARRRARR